MTARWLYVGGIDRSGTTILATFLAAHLGGVAVPESQFKKHLFGSGAVGRQDLVKIRGSFRFKLWDIDLDVDAFAGLTGKEVWKRLATKLLAEHAVREPAAIIDHTPDNIQFADSLLSEFEASCICHIIRDPRAVVASLMGTDWMIPSVERALKFWRMKNVSAEKLLSNSPKTPRILHVRYEDVCRHPDTVLETVLSSAGIAPAEASSDGCGAILLPSYTQTQHQRVALAPSDKEEWRGRLTEEEALFIESELADTLIGRLYAFRKHGVRLSRLREFHHLSKLPRMWTSNRSRRRRRSVAKITIAKPSSVRQGG